MSATLRRRRLPAVIGALIAATALIAGCTSQSGGAGNTVITVPTVEATSPRSPETGTDAATPPSVVTTTGRPRTSPSGSAGNPTTRQATHPATSSRPGSSSPSTVASSPRASASTGAGSAGLGVTMADVVKAGMIVSGLPLADRAASVIMASSADVVDSDLLADNHFGGVILMGARGVADGTSSGTPAEVLDLTTRLRAQASADPAGVPPLFGTDQEYGDVVRLVNGFTDFPGQSVLGSIPDVATAAALTRRIAAAAAQEMLAVGIGLDFAPVSDVLPADGDSAIGDRSYGSDPKRDAALVAAAVNGYQQAGVAATLKHFPGLGRVAQDTHDTLPTLDVSCSSWNSHEAVPLRAGIKAGVALVMTGHVQLPAVGDDGPPASLSGSVLDDLLRGAGRDGCTGLQFGGVTVSDSLQMVPIADSYSSAQAAVLALQAGEDLLLMPVRPAAAAAGIVAAVKDGSLSEERLDDAAAQVLALRLAAARIARPPLSVIDSSAHRMLAAEARAAAGR